MTNIAFEGDHLVVTRQQPNRLTIEKKRSSDVYSISDNEAKELILLLQAAIGNESQI